MAMKCAGVVVLLVAASMFAIAMASKVWNISTTAANWNQTKTFKYWGFWHKNATHPSNRFIVGGTEKWRFGYNYTDWAIKNGPFYMNDTLVFKYDLPNNTTFPHGVYLLPNFWSFQNCNFKWAKKIGEVNQGSGEGFEFTLKRWKPYYFARGERNGFHCKVGLMKFTVWPLIRWS